jgi:hypothetical protein
MKWPWQRSTQPAARDHSAEARRLLERVEAQQPKVDALAAELRRYQHANHLTARLAAALYGRPDAAGHR